MLFNVINFKAHQVFEPFNEHSIFFYLTKQAINKSG